MTKFLLTPKMSDPHFFYPNFVYPNFTKKFPTQIYFWGPKKFQPKFSFANNKKIDQQNNKIYLYQQNNLI